LLQNLALSTVQLGTLLTVCFPFIYPGYRATKLGPELCQHAVPSPLLIVLTDYSHKTEYDLRCRYQTCQFLCLM